MPSGREAGRSAVALPNARRAVRLRANSLGGRVNGVTVRDLLGGGDLYWRRPGYVVYVEPGLTWTLGPNMASLSVPVRVYANKLDSLLDRSFDPPRKVGESFASYLLLASYARRF
jgi:hypothetical protein